VDSEFNEYRALGNVKHLDADIADAPTEFEGLRDRGEVSDLVEFHVINVVYPIDQNI